MIDKITYKYVTKDYKHIKSLAINAARKKRYPDALRLIETAARLAYHLNFRYVDDELECMLQDIASKSLSSYMVKPIKNRYIFYDYFGLDNRGLTQQYLLALKEWDVDFLYIMENKKNEIYAQEILYELSKIKHAEVYIVPNISSDIEKATHILEKISQYRPEKAFLHLAPWSVLSIIVWNSLINVTRYLIDITDHAFWLGKGCSDYFIGFREYGYVISTKYRGISQEKIIIQSYYPILSTYPFQGFPEISNGKTIVFTGGSYYKMYGENNVFFNILKKIVFDNPSCIILLAGSGNSKPIEYFLKSNNIVDRVLLIGNRKDISEVFKHCDIYLNTFPIIGGLMSQYAVANNKPLIGYSDKHIYCNYSEGIFNPGFNVKFTYTDIEEFHLEVNHLIADKNYRDKKVINYPKLTPSPEYFAEELRKKLITKPVNINSIVDIDIDIDIKKFTDLYFYAENNFLHDYHYIKVLTLNRIYIRYDFFNFIKSFFIVLYFKKSKVFWTLTKKIKDSISGYKTSNFN
ncbi:MAG: hypothetical protein GQ532_01310 [Methylomarinum sp.]|nr:hypothetical protein [Methylomarinum sp.]